MVSFAESPFEDKRIHLRVRPLPGWCVCLSDDKPWGVHRTLAPLPSVILENKRGAGQRKANPDPVISITGRQKIIWYLSLLKAPIPSAPKIFPAKLNKRAERSFEAFWGEGVVERKQAQQAESWWQCRQRKELLKILSKKWNSHCAASFIWLSLTFSLALSLSHTKNQIWTFEFTLIAQIWLVPSASALSGQCQLKHGSPG